MWLDRYFEKFFWAKKLAQSDIPVRSTFQCDLHQHIGVHLRCQQKFYDHLHLEQRNCYSAKEFRFVIFILIVDGQVQNPVHIGHLDNILSSISISLQNHGHSIYLQYIIGCLDTKYNHVVIYDIIKNNLLLVACSSKTLCQAGSNVLYSVWVATWEQAHLSVEHRNAIISFQ